MKGNKTWAMFFLTAYTSIADTLTFKEYFRIGKENGRGEYMTTVAIFQHLRQKAGAAAMASTNLTTLSRRLKALPGMTSRRTWRGNEFLVELVDE